jgi:hypothetical protein
MKEFDGSYHSVPPETYICPTGWRDRYASVMIGSSQGMSPPDTCPEEMDERRCRGALGTDWPHRASSAAAAAWKDFLKNS